ncbi:MAG: hypothetical protein VX737_04975 [Pseudomonadota bacterium]|nr:hypothetical protein [Pseudomonadota bacterium]
MPKTHKDSKHNQQYLIDLYNLLDMLKLANVNSNILLSLANYVVKKLALTKNIYVGNGVVAAIISCIYLIRYRHSRIQEKTLINNQIQIEQLQECDNHSQTQNATIIKYLNHKKVDSIQHRLISFIVNMGMFYVTSYEIIQAMALTFPSTAPYLIPISNFPVLIAILTAFHLSKHHIKNLYRQHTQEEQLRNVLKRMPEPISNSKKDKNNHTFLNKLKICLCIITAISIFTLLDINAKTNVILCVLAGLSFYLCYDFENLWQHVSPYNTGLISGISAICTLFKFIQLHPTLFIRQTQKNNHTHIIQYISVSIYTTFAFLFGLNTFTNEKRKQTTKKILTSLESTELRARRILQKTTPAPHPEKIEAQQNRLL